MESDRSIHVNWLRFNIPQLVALIGATVTIMAYINNIDGRLEDVERYRATRSLMVDNRFNEVQTSLAPLVNLPYRVGVLEQQQIAITQRIDRAGEVISSTVEQIRKDVNGLSTRIEVLGTKIDNITPEKKIDFTPE